MTIVRRLRYATYGILSLFVGGLALANTTPATTQATGGGAIEEKSVDPSKAYKALFEKKCSQCHSLEKVLEMQNQKDADWWRATVKRMSEKPHANISKADLEHIMSYILKEMPIGVNP